MNCSNKGIVRKYCSNEGVPSPANSRMPYDEDFMDRTNKVLTKQANYIFNSNLQGNLPPMVTTAGVLSTNYNTVPTQQLIELESQLKGLSYKKTKCNNPEMYAYNDYKLKNQGKKHVAQEFGYKDSRNKLLTLETRSNKACNMQTKIAKNRFEPYCMDLQNFSRIQPNSYTGVSTRVAIKNDLYNMRKNYLEKCGRK